MIFAELFLELSVSPAADPLDVEANVGRIPVLVGVPAFRLAHDLERVEAPRRDIHRLRCHDRKDIAELCLAAPVLVRSAVSPSLSDSERPSKPRLRRCHSRRDSPILHSPRPAQVSRVERLYVSHPDEIERYTVDLPHLQRLDRLGSALTTAGPRIHPSISGTPAGRRGNRRCHRRRLAGRQNRRSGRWTLPGTAGETQQHHNNQQERHRRKDDRTRPVPGATKRHSWPPRAFRRAMR